MLIPCCEAPSLTRGWVCNLPVQLLLALPEQLFSGPNPAELITIFYCLIWDSPNLEGQVPVFISPRNRVAQLYPQAMGSLFVASYDCQGYGGGILTGFTRGAIVKSTHAQVLAGTRVLTHFHTYGTHMHPTRCRNEHSRTDTHAHTHFRATSYTLVTWRWAKRRRTTRCLILRAYDTRSMWRIPYILGSGLWAVTDREIGT
jgi:hypothetical protein